MNDVNTFLSKMEKEDVSLAISKAEKFTSGEIVVRIVQSSRKKLKDRFAGAEKRKKAVEARAEQEFLELGIQDTRDATGVLIMISLDERRVVVKADKSIDDLVNPGTWDETVKLIIDGIKNDEPGKGICRGVEQVGELLSGPFPIKEDDTDELSNEVIISD